MHKTYNDNNTSLPLLELQYVFFECFAETNLEQLTELLECQIVNRVSHRLTQQDLFQS